MCVYNVCMYIVYARFFMASCTHTHARVKVQFSSLIITPTRTQALCRVHIYTRRPPPPSLSAAAHNRHFHPSCVYVVGGFVHCVHIKSTQSIYTVYVFTAAARTPYLCKNDSQKHTL